MATLLVTGFSTFPGVDSNPSADLIARLRADPPIASMRLALEILPVTWAMLSEDLPALYAAHRPVAVVHFGVAARRRKLCVEACARNTAAGVDAAGVARPLPCLDPRGPSLRRTSLPIHALADAIATAGAPARISRDAGTYLCNATLWTSLGAGFPSAFVHLPQARECGGAVSLDVMERAARAVIARITQDHGGPHPSASRRSDRGRIG